MASKSDLAQPVPAAGSVERAPQSPGSASLWSWGWKATSSRGQKDVDSPGLTSLLPKNFLRPSFLTFFLTLTFPLRNFLHSSCKFCTSVGGAFPTRPLGSCSASCGVQEQQPGQGRKTLIMAASRGICRVPGASVNRAAKGKAVKLVPWSCAWCGGKERLTDRERASWSASVS